MRFRAMVMAAMLAMPGMAQAFDPDQFSRDYARQNPEIHAEEMERLRRMGYPQPAWAAQLSQREAMDARRAEDLRRESLQLEGRALRLQEQEAREGWMQRREMESRQARELRRADEQDRYIREEERRHNEAIRQERDRSRFERGSRRFD